MADLSKLNFCGNYSKVGKLLIPNSTVNPKLSIHRRNEVKGRQSPLYAMLIPESGTPSYLSGLYAREGHQDQFIMEVNKSYYVATLSDSEAKIEPLEAGRSEAGNQVADSRSLRNRSNLLNSTTKH